jgi:hypothetical protein
MDLMVSARGGYVGVKASTSTAAYIKSQLAILTMHRRRRPEKPY